MEFSSGPEALSERQFADAKVISRLGCELNGFLAPRPEKKTKTRKIREKPTNYVEIYRKRKGEKTKKKRKKD